MPIAVPAHNHISKPDGNSIESWFSYICGHCGTKVSGKVVAHWQNGTQRNIKWLLCPECVNGSVYNNGIVIPGHLFGPDIKGLPEEVEKAYDEARQCMKVNACTAAELICRKLLMYIAVQKGADEGKSFTSYLTFLEKEGYVTPPMKSWVELIRKHGNQATHRLDSPGKERAEGTVMFTAELLRLVYEMEFMAQQYTKPLNEEE